MIVVNDLVSYAVAKGHVLVEVSLSGKKETYNHGTIHKVGEGVDQLKPGMAVVVVRRNRDSITFSLPGDNSLRAALIVPVGDVVGVR